MAHSERVVPSLHHCILHEAVEVDIMIVVLEDLIKNIQIYIFSIHLRAGSRAVW